ncbi:anti-sigma factor [Nonomuraea phyllanthi]|uniref:Anti-sigma factor n=1 Tax=Nonomuraea phyllanthi TaxID=2219224 RepID=A0A5C4WW46_9ACTN|nr:anti-sigma factor [Nonomuraea phyllanthi]KAB8197403.1 anti-sigma factor [Nonomuraea phyllanthi]QFY06604.1 anti-sigma factor [Nonomuraea phyllanthi]
MKRFTCDELAGLVTAYLEDALDRPDLDGVRTHLATCEGCERYVEQFRATVVALGDPPPEKLPADVRSRLMSAFRERRRL